MEFKLISPNKIKSNSWNPNEMVPSVFEHLKKEVQRVGFIDPVTARRLEDGSLEIIDGYHRWKASKEIGLKEIPVIILEMSEDEAKLQTINLNQIKGEFNPVKFAELLQSLGAKYKQEEIETYLNMSQQEIDSYKMLLQMSDKELDETLKVFKEKPNLNEVKLIYNDQEFELFNKAISLTGITKTQDAVLEICRFYMEEMEK
jgi:ParB family chromosome partitioning protein